MGPLNKLAKLNQAPCLITNQLTLNYSSHSEAFCKRAMLKVRKIHRKLFSLGSYFNEGSGYRSATLIKGDSNLGVFM